MPALVHDGRVVIESNDILVYLEEQFPEPGFREVDDALQPQIDTWLRKSGDLHIPAIKTFQYYKLNAAVLEKTPEEEERYWKLQKDPELLAFHGKHSGGKSFSEADAAGAIALLTAVFEEMEQTLQAGPGWSVAVTASPIFPGGHRSRPSPVADLISAPSLRSGAGMMRYAGAPSSTGLCWSGESRRSGKNSRR